MGFSGVMDIVRGNWPDSDLSRSSARSALRKRPGREEVFKFYIEILLAEYGSKVFCRGLASLNLPVRRALDFAVAVAPERLLCLQRAWPHFHAGAGLAAKGRHMCLSEHAAYVGVTSGFGPKESDARR